MKTRHFLAFLSISFFYSFSAIAQNTATKADSLLKILSTQQKDTAKVITYNLLAAELWRNKTEDALKYADTALVLAEKLHYQRGLAHAHNYTGLCMRMLKGSTEALPHFQKALAIAELIKDKQLLARSNNNMGIVYLDQALYGKSLDYFMKGLAYNEQLNDTKSQASQLNNIGLIYKEMKDFKGALTTFQKALVINIKANNNVLLAGNYNNIGLVYRELSELDTALVYFQKAYLLNTNLGNHSASINLGNISEIYIQQKKIVEGKKHVFMAIKMNKISNNNNNLQSNYVNLADIYVEEKRYDSAENYMQQAAILNKSLNSRDVALGIFAGFANLYQKSENYKKSTLYLKQYVDLKDSIFNNETTEQIAKMQTIYETEKKEKENELLRKETILANTQLQRQFFMGIAGAGALLSVIVFALIMVRNNRQKQQTNKVLTKQTYDLQDANEQIMVQNEELHQQQEEITAQRDFIEQANVALSQQYSQIHKSVEAAKLIQDAILPYESRVSRFLPNYLVLYRPKDVVSGDFFWIEHINNRIFMAVVDCTGHGVPGAFMSMIANTLLDHIVKVQHIFSPDKILQALNEETQGALKQKDTENNNGMDAAFVCIDKTPENFILSFAGAKRPLYYVSAQTKQLEVIKGDKISIGGKHSFDKIFSKKIVKLPYNSTFYLFSDGYADQCNEQRISFGSVKLQELITKIAPLPIAEQKTILETALNDFRQNAEQRDDILLVGAKIEI